MSEYRSQTKLGSLVEAKANIIIGFSINWAMNMIVLPLFGFDISAVQAFGVGVIFTFVSLARTYILRRWFNNMKWGHR